MTPQALQICEQSHALGIFRLRGQHSVLIHTQAGANGLLKSSKSGSGGLFPCQWPQKFREVSGSA